MIEEKRRLMRVLPTVQTAEDTDPWTGRQPFFATGAAVTTLGIDDSFVRRAAGPTGCCLRGAVPVAGIHSLHPTSGIRPGVPLRAASHPKTPTPTIQVTTQLLETPAEALTTRDKC